MSGPLLVASPGGHLDELMILVERLGVPTDDAVWLSSPTSQTRSLLEGKEVVWVPRIGSGERVKAMAALPGAVRLHRRLRPSLVISTGGLFALPHLLAAAAHGRETWFVDSATRVDGPSSTGRVAQRLPRVQVFSQGKGWGDPRWGTVPSVLDTFESVPRAMPAGEAATPGPLRVVVTLGTERWTFPRAVDGVLRLGDAATVTWQTGTTVVQHQGQTLTQWLPAPELHAAIAAADVVVCHAGVGSVLACLRQGQVPVVLPRRSRHAEMVDDHQLEFARLLEEHRLAVCAEPDQLRPEHLARAAALTVRPRE